MIRIEREAQPVWLIFAGAGRKTRLGTVETQSRVLHIFRCATIVIVPACTTVLDA